MDLRARNIALSRLCTPTQAEAKAWFHAARIALGTQGLAQLGFSPSFIVKANSGRPMRGASLRMVWWAWSLTHCPSNLTNLFTWITWGRFNPAMPQDYKGQAIRLLHRATGPTRAKRLGKQPRRIGVAPWARAVTIKRQYIPSYSLPMLYG